MNRIALLTPTDYDHRRSTLYVYKEVCVHVSDQELWENKHDSKRQASWSGSQARDVLQKMFDAGTWPRWAKVEFWPAGYGRCIYILAPIHDSFDAAPTVTDVAAFFQTVQSVPLPDYDMFLLQTVTRGVER